jgi:hypothetical protein
MWSLGIGVWWSTAASLISSLLSKLKARSTYFENKTGTKVILQEIDGAELLEKASIVTTPTAYSDGVLHSVKPQQTLSEEMVTNGGFDTSIPLGTAGSGWRFTDSSREGSSAEYYQGGVKVTRTTNLSRLRPLVGNTTSVNFFPLESRDYVISYDLISTTDSSKVVSMSAGGQSVQLPGTVGSHTVYFKNGGTSGICQVAPGTNTDIVLDNISIKEVINADFTFTRNDAGTRVNASGNIESVGVDLPRIDYLGGSGSLLLEPQSQNLIQYSEDFSQGSYFTITSASVSSSTITDPTENQNSFKLIPDNGTGGNRSIGRNFLNLTNLHTFTCFAKKAEYNYLMLRTRNGPNTNVMFNLDNGTYNVNATSAAFVGAKIDDYGNGWYRCSITLDPSQMNTVGQLFVSLSVGVTGNETNSFSGDGVSGVYIFGMQFEEQSYPTSYIPTSGSPETRAADSALDAGSSDLINSTEGVFYAELKNIAEFVNEGSSIGINNGTAQSRINIFKTPTTNKLLIQVRAQNNLVNFGYTSNTTNVDFDKVAIKWKSGDYAIWINGVEVKTSTSTILPIGLDRVNFNGFSTTFQPFQGNVKCVAVFKEALTDAELTALTS